MHKAHVEKQNSVHKLLTSNYNFVKRKSKKNLFSHNFDPNISNALPLVMLCQTLTIRSPGSNGLPSLLLETINSVV